MAVILAVYVDHESWLCVCGRTFTDAEINERQHRSWCPELNRGRLPPRQLPAERCHEPKYQPVRIIHVNHLTDPESNIPDFAKFTYADGTTHKIPLIR